MFCKKRLPPTVKISRNFLRCLNSVTILGDQCREDDFGGHKTCPQMKTSIVLRNWISRETFTKILEFLYTGEVGISKDTEQDKIKELLTASKKLKVQSLEDICNYFLKLVDSKKDDDDQQKSQASNNASKKLQKPTPSPHSVQNLFLDKDATLFSDITFLVGDNLVYAHKAILVGRSPVFAALLSDNFREGTRSQVNLICIKATYKGGWVQSTRHEQNERERKPLSLCSALVSHTLK